MSNVSMAMVKARADVAQRNLGKKVDIAQSQWGTQVLVNDQLVFTGTKGECCKVLGAIILACKA